MSNPVTSFARGVVRTAMQRPRTPNDLVSALPTGAPSERLRGATVLITGSSSGIGAEAAEKFARRGATVLLVARRVEELDEVADLEEGRRHR